MRTIDISNDETEARDTLINRLETLVAQLQEDVRQIRIALAIAEQDIDRLEAMT